MAKSSAISRYHCGTKIRNGQVVTVAEPEEISIGDHVRFFSSIGPCLPAIVVGVGPTRFRLNFFGSKHFEYHNMVHKAPCTSCTNHPRTQYPNGYMD